MSGVKLQQRNNVFKQALTKFLVASWEDNANANIIQNLYIYAACGNLAILFEKTSLKRSHEEADSKILFHTKSINAPNIIRTADLDILLITLCKNFIIV